MNDLASLVTDGTRNGQDSPVVSRYNYCYLYVHPGAELKMDVTSELEPENSCRAARVAPCIGLLLHSFRFFFFASSHRNICDTIYSIMDARLIQELPLRHSQ